MGVPVGWKPMQDSGARRAQSTPPVQRLRKVRLTTSVPVLAVFFLLASPALKRPTPVSSMARRDELDPLHYLQAEWPSLRSATGRVDVHSLAAFWVRESRIEGDYFEFGVASGRSAVSAIRAAALYDWKAPARFHLFDSFQGLPALGEVDAGSEQFKEGDFAHSRESVIAHLERRGVWDPSRIALYEGWFADTLDARLQASFPPGSAAIVHIDCDLYESTRDVLNFVTPLLQPGTLMLLDDWNCFRGSNTAGERRAVREWIGRDDVPWELEHYVSYGWHGAGFVVDVKAR